MKVIKKIMVPVDFSQGGEAALDFAADLALRYAAELTIVHVSEMPPSLLPSGALPPSLVETWVSDMNQLLSDTERRVSKSGVTRVEAELLEGVPDVEIVRRAKGGDFDLIVMGTHGRSGVKHALIGSVAERVVRKAPCPVLTVRLAAVTGEER